MTVEPSVNPVAAHVVADTIADTVTDLSAVSDGAAATSLLTVGAIESRSTRLLAVQTFESGGAKATTVLSVERNHFKILIR